MSTRKGMISLAVAIASAGVIFTFAPTPASAGDGAVSVKPAIYRVGDDGSTGPAIQLVRRFYYGGPGYGYYRPYSRPYVYAPPPVAYGYSYPAYGYGYGYGYPAYGVGPAYGYGYPAPGIGYGYYGPRVGVGVGIW